ILKLPYEIIVLIVIILFTAVICFLYSSSLEDFDFLAFIFKVGCKKARRIWKISEREERYETLVLSMFTIQLDGVTNVFCDLLLSHL
ncbi:hypothetical protein DRO66_00140, partial [Candidatus Bathyarchaeota archaeon]